ncbi:MAG: hypothetical protein R2839_12980 [Thermomicrobiales bacterium]
MDRLIGRSRHSRANLTYALQPLLEEYFHSRHDRDGTSTLRRLMLDD